MIRGRKEILTDSDKEFIRTAYKQKKGSAWMLAQLKETNPNVKRWHIWGFASKEGISKSYKQKEAPVVNGFFDIKQYSKVVTI